MLSPAQVARLWRHAAPTSILRTKYATFVDAQDALRHVEVRTDVSDPAWWRIRDRSAPRLEGRYRHRPPSRWQPRS